MTRYRILQCGIECVNIGFLPYGYPIGQCEQMLLKGFVRDKEIVQSKDIRYRPLGRSKCQVVPLMTNFQLTINSTVSNIRKIINSQSTHVLTT